MDRRGNDGPSHASVGGHLEKMNSGMLEQTLLWSVAGTAVRHRGLVLSFSDRNGDATIIPYDSNGIFSVNLHVSNPNT